MSRSHNMMSIATVATALLVLNIDSMAMDNPLSRASLVLGAGVILLSAMSTFGKAQPSERTEQQQRSKPSATHIRGWRTRRANESRARQHSLQLMQAHLHAREPSGNQPTRH